MAKKKYKLGWGEEAKILSAIESGLLDGGDLVVTKDTKRLAFIDPNDEVIHFVKNRLTGFNTLEDARDYAYSSKAAYAGELISVLVNGKQKTYRLQSAESGYTLEDIESGVTGIKQYVQIVESFPDAGQEEGVIYISGTVGKIWTGSEWKTVFEDVASIKEELDKKAPIENPEFTGIVSVDGEEVALKSYVEQLISTMHSPAPGKVDGDNPLPESGYKAGQTWRVTADGTYAGQKCEVGDLIICVEDYSDEYSDDDFIIVQGNIDNAVTGVDSSTDGELVIFSGVSGKAIKNSGINIEAIEDVIAKSHEHANKDILDSFTKTEGKILQEAEDRIQEFSDAISERLIHSAPYVENDYLYANGHGLVIEAVDGNTNKATYYMSGKVKELTFPTNSIVIGGAKNDNCLSSSIVMNSGKIKYIHGGSFGDGDVAEANIVINGGSVNCVIGGGRPELSESGHANHTGHVNIVFNNVDNTSEIFGGGYSYATVGSVNIVVNKGAFSYVSAGGSNGYTSDATVEINGGTFECVQAVNRGSVGRAKIIMNDGNVTAMYTGVEPGEGSTGKIGYTELHLVGGTIQKLAKGVNDNVEDYDVSACVSGDYRKGVVSDEEANIFGLKLVNTINRSDVDAVKTETVKEVKDYVDSSLTLIEF